jgi:hypothetical protein
MRHYVWVLMLTLGAAPAFAQDQQLQRDSIAGEDEAALREVGVGGIFAVGNLAVRDIQRSNDPVQQFKRFFAEAKVPLSSAQERQLDSIVDSQIKPVEKGLSGEETLRRTKQEYARKINEVFTADQRTALRRYRTEQIMMGGGFQALKLILENAQAPFSPEQEQQALALYTEFTRQVDQIAKDSNGALDRAQLDKLENETLGKVVGLLAPPQRRALAASRRVSLDTRLRP